MHALAGVVAVVLAVDHPWQFDLTALAAFLAAAATGLLAFFTFLLASDTRDLARETGDDVRAQWRPVLITDKRLKVKVVGTAELASVTVELTNVGRGPALNTLTTISSESSVDSRASKPGRLGTVTVGNRAPSRAGEMLYRDASGNQQSRICYVLTAEYEDLAKHVYKTVLEFDDPERGNRPVSEDGTTDRDWELQLSRSTFPTPDVAEREPRFLRVLNALGSPARQTDSAPSPSPDPQADPTAPAPPAVPPSS